MRSERAANGDPEALAGAEPCIGGDPACRLHMVCESCGALLERNDDPHRPDCGANGTSSASPTA